MCAAAAFSTAGKPRQRCERANSRPTATSIPIAAERGGAADSGCENHAAMLRADSGKNARKTASSLKAEHANPVIQKSSSRSVAGKGGGAAGLSYFRKYATSCKTDAVTESSPKAIQTFAESITRRIFFIMPVVWRRVLKERKIAAAPAA